MEQSRYNIPTCFVGFCFLVVTISSDAFVANGGQQSPSIRGNLRMVSPRVATAELAMFFPVGTDSSMPAGFAIGAGAFLGALVFAASGRPIANEGRVKMRLCSKPFGKSRKSARGDHTTQNALMQLPQAAAEAAREALDAADVAVTAAHTLVLDKVLTAPGVAAAPTAAEVCVISAKLVQQLSVVAAANDKANGINGGPASALVKAQQTVIEAIVDSAAMDADDDDDFFDMPNFLSGSGYDGDFRPYGTASYSNGRRR